MSSSNYQICLTSVDNQELAEKIAKNLLQQKLVACVNIINNVSSMYHWQGKIVTDTEWLLVMKTDKLHANCLRSAILDVHNYDVPEFLTLNIENGNPDYLNWITQNLSKKI